MRQIKFALAFAAALSPLCALAQSAPANLGYHTVYGRLGAVPGDTGPGQAIPFATLLANIAGTQSANTVYAGPASGGVANPGFRILVGADLPVPGASSLGGVQSKTCSTSNWFSTLSTGGVLGCSQPAFSDISGTIAAAQLPNPTASTLGGVKSKVAVTHQFLNAIGTDGGPTSAQPACTDLSDATSCNAARGQLPGETSTGNASAGNVGEYVSSTIAIGSAVSQSNNAIINITSISLTAGDWDVNGSGSFTGTSTSAITFMDSSISLVSATQDTTVPERRNALFTNGATIFNNITQQNLPTGPTRISLSTTTTVFLIGRCTFSASTCSTFGTLRARRVR